MEPLGGPLFAPWLRRKLTAPMIIHICTLYPDLGSVTTLSLPPFHLTVPLLSSLLPALLFSGSPFSLSSHLFYVFLHSLSTHSGDLLLVGSACPHPFSPVLLGSLVPPLVGVPNGCLCLILYIDKGALSNIPPPHSLSTC